MYANVIFSNDCILISFDSYFSGKSYFRSFYREGGSRIREKAKRFWTEGVRQGFCKYECAEEAENSELKATSISKEENTEIIEFGNKIIKFVKYIQNNINIPTNLFLYINLDDYELDNFKYNCESLQDIRDIIFCDNQADFIKYQDEIEDINKFDYNGESDEIIYTDFQSGENYIINVGQVDAIHKLIEHGVLKGMINEPICRFSI